MVTWKRVTRPGDTPTGHVALTAGRPGGVRPERETAAHAGCWRCPSKEARNLMRYRLLGKTGVRISEVALGTMTFGEDWGWGGAAGCRREDAGPVRRRWRQCHRHRQRLHQRVVGDHRGRPAQGATRPVRARHQVHQPDRPG